MDGATVADLPHSIPSLKVADCRFPGEDGKATRRWLGTILEHKIVGLLRA